MKIKLISIVLFILFSYLNTETAKAQNKTYEQLWKEIKKYEDESLPKSAYKVADEIYLKASEENNSPQLLKSFIFRMKLKDNYEEDAFENLLAELDSTINTAKFPEKAIMHSMLADMYLMYYRSNRYKFINRSNTINFENNSIKTWTLDYLAYKVIQEYRLSLNESEKLQKIPVEQYELLLTAGGKRNLRPTLYDFLANKALNVFKNTELSLTKPIDNFEINNEFYFSSASRFVHNRLFSSDTLSFKYQSMRLYKELISFRLKNENEFAAFIDVELLRLKYVYEKSVNPEKDKFYFNALKTASVKYQKNDASAEIQYAIAEFYFENSTKYKTGEESTSKFKYYKTKAHTICSEIIKKHTKTEAAEKSKTLVDKIEIHHLGVQHEHIVIPNTKFPVKIDYRNTNKVFIKVASINRSEYDKLTGKYYNYDMFNNLIKTSKTIHTYSKKLPEDKDFNTHSSEFIIDELPLGLYVIFISDNEKFSYKKAQVAYSVFNVSNLSYAKQRSKDNSYRITVFNRTTGEPEENVKCQIWTQKWSGLLGKYVKNKTGLKTTDKNGMIFLDSKTGNSESVFIDFTLADDFLSSERSLYLYNYNSNESSTIHTEFFTDRAIYRPGQTVHFKGLVLRTKGERTQIVPIHNETVTLQDPNYQKVSDLKLTSNEYGTFSGSFDIPRNLRNGNFTITCASGTKYIKVEEYKRPKFETNLLPFTGNYLLNDKVIVKGEAISFSGAPLSNAEVKYRIKRSPRWSGWWSYYYDSQETEIAHGNCTSNEKGVYEFDFQAVPDKSYTESPFLSFNYSISIDVTDINGETQSTAGSIRVGYRALTVGWVFEEGVDKRKFIGSKDFSKIKIITNNLNGEFVPAKGKIKIYELIEPTTILKHRYWNVPDKFLFEKEVWKKQLPSHLFKEESKVENLKKGKLVLETDFDTEKVKTANFTTLSSKKIGKYLIEIESKDAFDNEVSNKKFFTLFDSDKNKMPNAMPLFFKASKNFCEVGETAEFLIGSSYKDAYILYQIEHKNKIVKQEYLKLSNETKLIKIPVNEEYRGNFSVHFTMVRDNRFYTKNSVVTVPYSNKNLDIEFSTFRDKLQPGQDEQWKITIKGHEGEKAAAEMLAGMYDASLDQFAANYWGLNIYKSFYTRMSWSGLQFSSDNARILKTEMDEIRYPSLESYDYFNWFGFNYYNRYYYRSTGGSPMFGSKRSARNGHTKQMVIAESSKEEGEVDDFDMDAEEPIMDSVTGETISSRNTKKDKEAEKSVISGKTDFTDVKIRTNFNETAFFYPHLQTNEKGEIIIKFTVPESLTKWKLMTLAHTKDLKFATAQREIVTQKELMLMPNSPRFFRENDKITFPVKISSLAKEELQGQVKLEFVNPITNKTVKNLFIKGEKQTKDFTIKPEGNINISWDITIPEDIGALSYKVVAKSGNFSDGEQKALPVLTNRMLVTESMPLPIKGNSEKTFKFKKLINSGKSKTLKHHKLTLEFTSNPAWYAVQALPYIMEYPYECNEQTFSRYYANSLASFIANSDPKIKRVFEAWKNTDTDALVSNLEKNEELKSVLLQETPWVLDGKNESERKKRIGLLFDLNRMQNETSRALKKLKKEQYGNGSWPWFSGMPESRYITQHIVTGLGHLKHLEVISITDPELQRMISKAVAYLDGKISKDYKYLKKNYTDEELKQDHLSYTAIHYLYGRSFFTDIPIPKRDEDAYNYYRGQTIKYWQKRNLYSKGMIALALHRTEGTETALKIMKSIKEHSTTHEELGRYWKNNTRGWYWYQAPIETQALMIEAFTEVVDEPETVEELKIWLLKQKQTQDWNTTKATTEAIYALLLQGADLLASDAITEVYLDNKLIDPNKIDGIRPQAGTGYFKTSWNGNDINPKMGNVKLIKKDAGVAWGSLYWQYFEQLDKITHHETPLKLEKELFVERITDAGSVIEPISGTELKVGDKVIVRIELRTDRRMEYIHMKDMRASGFEPVNVFSSYRYQDGLGYYQSTKDASTNFFIEYLPKGTYVFEYALRVAHKGDFSNGITTIQCMYAPEFTSHSEGVRVEVR